MDVERVLVYEEEKYYSDAFVIRTDFHYDLETVRAEWRELSKRVQWYQDSQTCLQYSANDRDKWTDGCGSIKRWPHLTEQDFRITNPLYHDTIFEDIMSDLDVCRSRIMMLPKNKCYSIHADRTHRFHLALDTHEDALFLFRDRDTRTNARLLHIPANGYVYFVNTTKLHSFMNAGGPNRTHMVMCPKSKEVWR